MSSRVSKTELLRKINDLSSLSNKELSKLPFSIDELNYLKKKIINDELGFTFNFYEKDEDLLNNYFALEEIKKLHINPKDANNNLIIEGDNYYALKALKIANIKVDVIYIDPPYNTGNKDFIYNDDYVNKDDENKHSKWLSFMKKRLELAKELLAEDGVIFVSIDDNEQAYLKILMDQIFGEDNFVSNLIWRKKNTGGGSDKKTIENETEFIICYGKNKDLIMFNGKEIDFSKFNLEDEYVNERGKYSLTDLDRVSSSSSFQYIESLDYEIKAPDGTMFKNYRNIIKPKSYCYTLGKELFDFYNINGFIEIKKIKDGYWKAYRKSYSLVTIDRKLRKIIKRESGNSYNNLIDNGSWTTSSGKRLLIKILDNKDFPFPKPHNLIKYLLKMINKNNAIILDFFAGSGTTAQAVMELNQEDGGNRRFILATNNENNIARDICRERIYRVINGVGSNNEKIDWVYSDEIKSLKNNHVKYLKVKYIHKVNGEFEEINECKEIYKKEFNKEISIKDFIDN